MVLHVLPSPEGVIVSAFLLWPGAGLDRKSWRGLSQQAHWGWEVLAPSAGSTEAARRL